MNIKFTVKTINDTRIGSADARHSLEEQTHIISSILNGGQQQGSTIQVYDTTLRDGNQAVGVTFSVNDKVKISRVLDEIGVSFIEGGWPNQTNTSEIDYFKRMKGENLKAEIVAFGRTRKPKLSVEEDKELEVLSNVEPDVVAIVGKAWKPHIEHILGTDLENNLSMISDTIRYYQERGFTTFFDAEHFFDGYKEDQDYALKVLKTAQEGGASMLVLCDTRGAATPLEIYEVFKEVSQVTSRPLGAHMHDDRGLATSNSIFAVLGSANQVQGTINGIGERCGNADLIEVVCNLEFSFGVSTGLDLSKLTSASHYVGEVANLPLDKYKPFTGKYAFAHKGGVHGHAVIKHPQAYEAIDPSIVGNHRIISVSSQAGLSNIVSKGRQFGFNMSKQSSQAKKILDRIKELEARGYSFENAEASLYLLYCQEMGERLDFFDIVNWRAYVLFQNGGLSSESTVKLKLEGGPLIRASEGVGPVNAFDLAFREALKNQYPEISDVELVGYRVREVDVERGTAAYVQVFIEFKAENEGWATVGVSDNILKASEEALTDGYTYYLKKSREKCKYKD